MTACVPERDPESGTDIESSPHASPHAPAETLQGEHGAYEPRELAGGFVHPWALAFLPDGAMLVTERSWRLRRIGKDGAISEPLSGVPKVFAQDRAACSTWSSRRTSPTTARHLSYGEPNWRGNMGGTAVARGRLGDAGLEGVEVVFRQEPKLSHGTHRSRIVRRRRPPVRSAGDNRDSGKAQLLDHLQGKIVRLDPDGSIPGDNPFAGRGGARGEIWSYGHRNIQGMALNPRTRALWSHEHGPMGGDEINLPQPGRNYGWPLATFGREYNGGPVPEAVGTEAPGTEPPHHYWPVSPAVSGMAFYEGDAFPHGKATCSSAHWPGRP